MCAPCVTAQKVIKTNSIDMMNIAPPPIKDKISSESLKKFSNKINAKIIAKVNKPNVSVDMCFPSVASPRIIQLNDTMTEFDTSRGTESFGPSTSKTLHNRTNRCRSRA